MENTAEYDQNRFISALQAAMSPWLDAHPFSLAVEKLGVSESKLRRWLRGDNVPDAVELAAVCRLVGTSPSALLGFGGPSEPAQVPVNYDDVVFIPVIDVALSAGFGREPFAEAPQDRFPFSVTELRRLGVSGRRVEALRVAGDSMWPTIEDGALVLVDRNSIQLVEGKIFALRSPDGPRLKRIQRAVDGAVILISDNREIYQPERISPADAERISIIGRAFWADRRL